MNEVFNDGKIIVHDDRDFIDMYTAFNLLTAGESIDMCDPPDYSSDDLNSIHPMPMTVSIDDIPVEYHSWPSMQEYLQGYDLSK